MLPKISFSVISILIFSSPSLAVYRGLFTQICYPYTTKGTPRFGAQGVCINDCAAISLGGKPSILTYSNVRMQDGGCSAGRDRKTPCKVGASAFGRQNTECDEYPYGTTTEGAASRIPAVLRCIPDSENRSGGQQLSQFLNHPTPAVVPGDTFSVGFVWGQPMTNNLGQQVLYPPIPAAAMQMCETQYPVNDGAEFRMILTTQLFRRFTSVFRRETTELREVTTERKSAAAEPIWLRTAQNLTVMAYGDIKLGTPVWSDLHDGEDEVDRIIDSSDPEYPPKLSTKSTGNESGGASTKVTGGKSTKMTGATPTAPAKSAATKVKATGSKSVTKLTKPAAKA
ncbi:hypothetical protein F5146DRAFT_1228154 [Armillaria mellea]|nr:hypothetical protein F5146DRAFT_1228154 [Armillaria mellea]